MLGPALPQGALPQVVDAVLSRRHLRGLQVRHVSVSGYAFRAAAWHCMLGKCVCNVARTVSGMAAHQLCTVERALLGHLTLGHTAQSHGMPRWRYITPVMLYASFTAWHTGTSEERTLASFGVVL